MVVVVGEALGGRRQVQNIHGQLAERVRDLDKRGRANGRRGGVYKVPSLLGPWILDRVSDCQGQAACQGGRSKKPADTSSIRILKPHPRSGTVWMATGSNQGSGNRGVAQRGPMHRSSSSETVTEHWPLGQHAVVPGGSWELGAGLGSGSVRWMGCASMYRARERQHTARSSCGQLAGLVFRVAGERLRRRTRPRDDLVDDGGGRG